MMHMYSFGFTANNTPPEAVPEGVQDAYLTAESLRRGLVCVDNTFSYPVVPHSR